MTGVLYIAMHWATRCEDWRAAATLLKQPAFDTTVGQQSLWIATTAVALSSLVTQEKLFGILKYFLKSQGPRSLHICLWPSCYFFKQPWEERPKRWNVPVDQFAASFSVWFAFVCSSVEILFIFKKRWEKRERAQERGGFHFGCRPQKAETGSADASWEFNDGAHSLISSRRSRLQKREESRFFLDCCSFVPPCYFWPKKNKCLSLFLAFEGIFWVWNLDWPPPTFHVISRWCVGGARLKSFRRLIFKSCYF